MSFFCPFFSNGTKSTKEYHKKIPLVPSRKRWYINVFLTKVPKVPKVPRFFLKYIYIQKTFYIFYICLYNFKKSKNIYKHVLFLGTLGTFGTVIKKPLFIKGSQRYHVFLFLVPSWYSWYRSNKKTIKALTLMV